MVKENITDFMKELSTVTEQNDVNITKSAGTVQAIVDILFIIAKLSQSVPISEPVMKVCLFTFKLLCKF